MFLAAIKLTQLPTNECPCLFTVDNCVVSAGDTHASRYAIISAQTSFG